MSSTITTRSEEVAICVNNYIDTPIPILKSLIDSKLLLVKSNHNHIVKTFNLLLL